MRRARNLLQAIQRMALPRPLRIMNVCGGHERTLAMAGLRRALPEGLEIVAGPGCPVCVCPEEELYAVIRLALEAPVTVAAFGDMLRVPVNAPKAEPRSLEAARSAGADIRPVASPQEAAALARAMPGREVVFFVAGFETTTAPVAALLAEGVPKNLSVHLAARRTWPAVARLLEDGARLDGMIAPGHVASVMGAREWAFVAETHGLPVIVSGFAPEHLLAAVLALLRQIETGEARLENGYPEVVGMHGNPTARRVLHQVMEVGPARWRGLGTIPNSGFALRPTFAAHDSGRRFPLDSARARKRMGEMPPGCACAEVVTARLQPTQCRLYGRACTPSAPVGPCMVSEEGACRIRWTAGERAQAAQAGATG